MNRKESEQQTRPVMPQIEPCITIADLAERLKISYEKVRRMVMDEPGVLCFGEKRTMYRIPESVAERIVRRSATLAAK